MNPSGGDRGLQALHTLRTWANRGAVSYREGFSGALNLSLPRRCWGTYGPGGRGAKPGVKARSTQRRTAMTTTALGLFEGVAEAQRVAQTLVAQGIQSEDITIIANREETSVSDVLVAAAWGINVDVGPASRGAPAALIALGVPADEVQAYAMVLDGGGALVSVMADKSQ